MGGMLVMMRAEADRSHGKNDEDAEATANG
jgi:hypothetical protein